MGDVVMLIMALAVILPAFAVIAILGQMRSLQARVAGDNHIPVRDVALATSAAPMFFPIASVDGQLFVDGGLFAQSPDLVAIHEAEHVLGVDRNAIRLLSIGTTTSKYSLSETDGTDYGLVNWAYNSRLWRAIISTQQQIVDYMSRNLLSNQYVRIDALQSEAQQTELGLDVASEEARRIITGLAENAMRESFSKLDGFVAHQAPDAIFYRSRNAAKP